MPPENKLTWFLIATLTTVALATLGSWGINTERDVAALTEHANKTDRLVIEINTKLDLLLVLSRIPAVKPISAVVRKPACKSSGGPCAERPERVFLGRVYGQ